MAVVAQFEIGLLLCLGALLHFGFIGHNGLQIGTKLSSTCDYVGYPKNIHISDLSRYAQQKQTVSDFADGFIVKQFTKPIESYSLVMPRPKNYRDTRRFHVGTSGDLCLDPGDFHSEVKQDIICAGKSTVLDVQDKLSIPANNLFATVHPHLKIFQQDIGTLSDPRRSLIIVCALFRSPGLNGGINSNNECSQREQLTDENKSVIHRRHSKSLMDSAEFVIHEPERDGGSMIA